MFSSISPLAATTDVSFQKRRAVFSWEVSVKFLKILFETQLGKLKGIKVTRKNIYLFVEKLACIQNI